MNGLEGTSQLQEYVVGFAFDTWNRVALIRKNRPEWQAGKLNGIGGHVEPGEDPDEAMIREFREETGTYLVGWKKFVVMDFPGARIHFYRLLDIGFSTLDGLITATDEDVVVVYPSDLATNLSIPQIPNLAWLIPLAAYTADDYEVLHVQASKAEALA